MSGARREEVIPLVSECGGASRAPAVIGPLYSDGAAACRALTANRVAAADRTNIRADRTGWKNNGMRTGEFVDRGLG
jgi:hypothetical protein